MQSVVETPAYLAAAREEGMTAEEMAAAVDLVAANPGAGDLIVGSGGCRKVRVAGKGRGKSGGYRVVTFFGGDDVPVFLLAVLAKGTRANFSKSERNAMRHSSPYDLALDYAALGEIEPALDQLELSHGEHETDLLALAVDPRLDPLRGEPRFQALLERMGLALHAAPPS